MGKNEPRIKILDPIHCWCNKEARKLIKPYLKYKSSFYKKSQFGGKTIDKTCHMITGKDGTAGHFYSGLFPMIKKNLRKDNIKITIEGKQEKFKPFVSFPEFKDITLRKQQIKAFKKVKLKQRGRILLPTGYGKTTIAVGIIKMFINLRILYLQHTRDILTNNSNTLKKHNIKHIILDGDNKVNWDKLHKLDNIILLSTIQSLSKIPKEYWHIYFDLVLIDEHHHLTSEKTQYGKLLTNILAPMRIGLSATDPTGEYEKLLNEALLGPVLSEITNVEAIEEGVLAKPEIKLIQIPFNNKINSKSKTYREYRLNGIVKNKIRNEIIVTESIRAFKKDESTLIIIEDIKHGKILQRLFQKDNLKVPFVQGQLKREKRELVRNNLESKKIFICICTKVWREGIDISSLNQMIYAAGLFEEKLIKQALGRGQRISENKTSVRFIDFLDPYRHLSEHVVKRIGTYVKEGWL